MNGQEPPRRKRASRPDPHPTETPRPTRPRRAKAVPPPASAATSAAPPEPAPPPAPIVAPAPLPDRMGDVSPALTPRQMAFMALVAAVILAIIRRLVGRGRRGRD